MAASRRQGSFSPHAGVEKLSAESAAFYSRVYGAARAGCLNELRKVGCGDEEAEEILAASFERIMRKHDPIAQKFLPSQMVVLLKKACRDLLIDERRRAGILRQVPVDDARGAHDTSMASPTETAETKEAIAMGREAIASLSSRDRKVFFQRHQLGLSPDEIRKKNPGLSSRTYRKVLQRANARALKAFVAIDSGTRCGEMEGGHLRKYVAGETSGAEHRTVLAHLQHCRSCQITTAKMQGYLHDIAGGLVLAASADRIGSSRFADSASWVVDNLSHGGNALADATRGVRERLRELAVRAATSSGASGETAVGQAIGASGAKVAAVCAGSAVAACVATGVVPIGSFVPEPREVKPGHIQTKPAARRAAQPRSSAPLPQPKRPEARKPEKTVERPSQGAQTPTAPPTRHEPTRKKATVDNQTTGEEFGADSTGAGIPLPNYGSSPSVGEASQADGESTAGSDSGGGSSGGGSGGSAGANPGAGGFGM